MEEADGRRKAGGKGGGGGGRGEAGSPGETNQWVGGVLSHRRGSAPKKGENNKMHRTIGSSIVPFEHCSQDIACCNFLVWLIDFVLSKVRGSYYISIDQVGAGALWRRKTGQEIYSPIVLAFTHENMEAWTASHLTNGTAMDPGYNLPLNVALITLQELDDGSVLLRLAHLFEAGEDANYSTLAKVELKKMFAGKTIKGLNEMSLSANQAKSEMKRMNWNVEGESKRDSQTIPIRGGPVDNATLVVELGPMEIRTFLLKL